MDTNFSRQHFQIFFFSFPENRIRHFMQIVSIGDNLHEMSNSMKNKKNITKMSSAELAQRVVKVKRNGHSSKKNNSDKKIHTSSGS